ncbi:MAG: ATP-binding protein [Chloroflexota bacterium]
MFYLELKWVILAVFVISVGLPSLIAWLARWGQTQQPAFTVDQETLEILGHAPFGFMLLQQANTYCEVNAYARRMLNLQTPTGTLPDEDWVGALLEDRQAVRQGQSLQGRYRFVSLPHNQFVQWWVFPQDAQVDAVFLLDVTTQQQIRQNSQLLFNGFSHELRTPIATIATHLEVLNVPDVTPDIKTQSVHILKEEARRMGKLVDQMVDLGRLEAIESVELRPLHLQALVEDTLAQARPLAHEKELTLNLEAETPLPVVVGDDHRLKQVFLNLLDNALKYTPAGGTVTVSLSKIEEGVRCAVEDTGVGIPDEHIAYVTRHFYRVDKQGYEGSGLGLAIVDQVLQNHQSKLQIESCVRDERRQMGSRQMGSRQMGTRVSFMLPTLSKE